MDIKKPRFDNPRGLGTTGRKRMVDPTMVEIKPETRVVLVYQGKDVTVNVTKVIKPGSEFVGRIRGFEGHEIAHADLKSGDMIHFKKDDVRWID